jgi:hypothetical protein
VKYHCSISVDLWYCSLHYFSAGPELPFACYRFAPLSKVEVTDRNIYTDLIRPPQISRYFMWINMKADERASSHVDGSYDCPEVTPLLALQGLDLGTEGTNPLMWQVLSDDARL